jgi:hypothetical protein
MAVAGGMPRCDNVGNDRWWRMEIVPRHTDLPLLLRHPGQFARRYRWALLVLLLGATADMVTTLINLRRFGPGVEVHPAQRLVSEIVGVTAGVPVAKVIQLACVLAVAAWWRRWCQWLLLVCGVLYLLAAVSNHFLLL